MNSSCKFIPLLLLAGFFVFQERAGAIQLSALYFSACERDVGVILNADDDSIKLLSLDGRIRTFYRFEIIYIANYSLRRIPIPQVANPEEVDVITIKTRHQGRIVALVRGWMIDHSGEAYSFLSLNGEEVIVRADDIWDIEISKAPGPVVFRDASARRRFVHPYPFRHCNGPTEGGITGGAPPREVYPQQLLADPFLIKNALDHLRDGQERLNDYISSKVFYPEPQLYGNETRLGMWLTGGSRHGASTTRNNSLVPVLTNELSEGPFGFQRIWIAGATPMPFSVHEEPQTQLYYRLKAGFVHFSAMYDLSRALIGESKYKWRKNELGGKDDRWNEIFHIAGGVDYAPFAGDVSNTTVQYAIRHKERFFTSRVEMAKFGIFYQAHGIKAELYTGSASDAKPGVSEISEGNEEEEIIEAQQELAAIAEFSTTLRLTRFNLAFTEWAGGGLSYSLIYRSTDFFRDPDQNGQGKFKYASKSLTNALYWGHALSDDIGLSGFVSLENLANKAGINQLGDTSRRAFLKGGLSVELKL